jgi:hypothetical protein
MARPLRKLHQIRIQQIHPKASVQPVTPDICNIRTMTG